ncbi:MAG: alpha/beta fold hydrolase [Deltaproteobacteria bacterium]|nr:alpha/beta fold hydrolase [Deltaproteobacteria bacterium]
MPARLHHERLAPSGEPPTSWLLLTHGIYGAGTNWRAIARKLTERRPAWGVVLVDLRQHGRSEPGEPPHTVTAAAEDLAALVTQLAAEDVAITAIGGHSFGGKVALATRALVQVQQTWVFDASPGARPDGMSDHGNTVVHVLELLERLPRTWAKREDFVAAVRADGQGATLAQWLAMNVVPDAAGVPTLRLDTAALRSMLADYYALDLWASAYTPEHGALEFVIAQRSSTIDAAARTQLASSPPHVRVHVVDADHWLHVEVPDVVVTLLADHLP